MTTIELDDLGTFTPLESNKSLKKCRAGADEGLEASGTAPHRPEPSHRGAMPRPPLITTHSTRHRRGGIGGARRQAAHGCLHPCAGYGLHAPRALWGDQRPWQGPLCSAPNVSSTTRPKPSNASNAGLFLPNTSAPTRRCPRSPCPSRRRRKRPSRCKRRGWSSPTDCWCSPWRW